MRLKFADISVRTALLYWVAATLWILLSDRLLDAFVSDAETLSRVQTVKGWAFVSVSAVVLFVALRAQLRISDRESERRRKAEDNLRLKGAALDAAANSVVITAADGRIVWVNPAFSVVSGYSLDEVLGKNPREVAKSGRHDDAFYRKMWETITAGCVWRGEVTNRRKDGKLIIEDLTITPVRDERGAISHFVGIKQELTETKRLEAQLMRAQRLESVGRLAGGIAHDLNNVLTPILAGSQLMRDEVRSASGRELLENVVSSAHRGADIIRQILTFSRGIESARASIQLPSLVAEMQGIMRHTFPKSIDVRTEVPADLAAVNGDATQLHQVLMNLCINARDAMPDGGTLTISLRNADVDETFSRLNPDAKPGRYVALSIRDTGTGIASEHIEQVFDPFFTTKEIGKGTGLGLSSVLGIVKAHHGFLTVESSQGAGTQFNVFLPAETAAEVMPIPSRSRTPPRGNGELVLVVDDESSIRGILRQLLEHGGYHVIEAADGAEALSKYLGCREEVCAVITDADMASVSGLNFVNQLKQENNTAPIIVITGSRDFEEISRFRELGVSGVLTKPFLPDDLLLTLQRSFCEHAQPDESA